MLINSSHEVYMQFDSNALQHEENNAYKSFLTRPMIFDAYAYKEIMPTHKAHNNPTR